MNETRERLERRGEDARFIQSLDRGLILLEALSEEGRDSSLSDLAARFAWDKSTTFRMLATLIHRGYVDQDAETNKYRLGLKILKLSGALNRRLDIKRCANPFMDELARISRETAHLAVLDGGEVVILDQQDSPETIRVNSYVGMREPAHCTALGKVLLAYLPDRQLEHWMEGKELRIYTKKTITSPTVLTAHLSKVREQGYAFDDEEYDIGMRCVASPVQNSEGKVVAAVGISGPAQRITWEDVNRYANIVKEIAHKVSRNMGYPG